MSRRLLVVSNRGPVSYARGDGGVRVARRGGGGLVTALAGLVATHEVTWVCSAIGDEDRAVAEESGGEAIEEQDAAGNPFRLRLVPHDPDDYDRFYNVFANPLLWFVQHDLWGLALEPDIDATTRFAWASYQTVNQALAEAAGQELERLGPDTSVMLHDYQLYTAPAILRREAPQAIISHFCHIPWPGPASWRVVPTVIREAIADGLLACDVVGFHTRRYANEFLRFCQDLGYETSREEAAVRVGSRWVQARAYPISVDPEAFAALAELPEVRQQEERIEEDRPERIVLRVDRTDPSKNIVRGFRAFDLFLQQHPEWHGRVRMLALLDPSRQEIPEYAEYLAQIHRTARQVGARWLDGDGHPAIDLRIQDNFPEVIAGYRQYDVLFVNALIDGMNLIAKEAPLVNARNGVLILSENAGAYAELGEWAVSVNPFDLQGQADAIAAALDMPEQERRRRAEGIRDHVREHDVRAWIDAQLADLDAVGAGR